MAGLELIGTYSSDSENEEAKGKSIILPLPKDIASWAGVEYHDKEASDEPKNHGGRIRAFQHERGNWATLVYVDYEPSEALISWMSSINDIVTNGNSIVDQCHISLTRTLILKFHWIESFVDSLKKLCQGANKFNIELGGLQIYCNDEKTRTFIGIECGNQDHHFTNFMNSLNKILTDYKLPSFYKNVSYHISFLWLLGNQKEKMQQLIPTFDESLHDTLAKNMEPNHIKVSQIYCKIGNKLFKFPLR